MKSIITKFSLVLSLILAWVIPANSQRVEKQIQESFNANPSTLLVVESKFGDVQLMTHDEDEIDINITIWAGSNRREKAEELLSGLDAEVSMSGNVVTVRSIFSERLNTNKNTKFRIDMDIHIPEYINLNLTNKYGSAFIDELAGHANIEVAYGNLKIRELSRGNEKPMNHIDLAYSSGSIEEAGWLKLDIAYSKMSIEEARAVMAITKYSGFSVEEVSSMVIESKYDTYSIDEINNFLGVLKYGNLKIDELSSKFEIESKYTSVKIDEIGPDFDLIKIDNSRGGYKLGLSENASFRIEGTAIRGDISVYGMDKLNRRVENANKYIDGIYGKNPSSVINIKVLEGNVKLSLD